MPLLAVQGINDTYGTLERIHGIARRVPQTEIVELEDCGYSPHRDKPQQLIEIISRFLHDAKAVGDVDHAGFHAQH
jgi:pimeloyl-ACP methyl ester carboxylesterase